MKVGTVSLGEISMSDPFIYSDEKSRTYYLTGTGGRLYKSQDLKMWTGPHSIIDLEGDNSGHGMLLRTFEGKLLFILHHAEANGPRKPQIWDVDDSGDKLVQKDRYRF